MSTIRQSDLRSYATRRPVTETAVSFSVAKAAGRVTIFLCHSHKDDELAKGLKNRLREQDVDLYIDWEDTTMPDSPNQETATKIQTEIRDCTIFLFLATQNSLQSRWCPWEIGYADGKKAHDSIVVVPTQDDQGTYHGNEYLQLYSRLIITAEMEKYGVFAPSAERGAFFERFAKAKIM